MALKKLLFGISVGVALHLTLGFATQAIAQENGFTIDEAESVQDAVEQIVETLEEQGFQVIDTIDHAAAAASVGLELLPTQVILFSNPQADTKLIRKNQTAGIDFPEKALVWEDASGTIRLNSLSPCFLARRHGFKLKNRRLEEVGEAAEQFTPDTGLVIVESMQSFDATVASLKSAIEASPLNLRLEVDHSAIATSVEKKLPPTVLLIFGNPNIGSQLMQNSRLAAIDLPQKMLVWENKKGQVFLAYNDPQFLATVRGIDGLGAVLAMIATALNNLAQAATAG